MVVVNAPVATVYLVTNRVNGNTYVGVTRYGLAKRWSEHVCSSSRRPRSWLHRSIRKYGVGNFMIEPIASCFSVDAGRAAEQELIRTLAPVYNQTNGGEITVGRRGGPELYVRIAAKNRGIKRTPEQVAKNSAQATKRLQDPAYRQALLEAGMRGLSHVDEAKRVAAVRKAHLGKPLSAERRAKLSAERRKNWAEPGYRERMTTLLRSVNENISLDTKKRMSESAKKRGMSESLTARAAVGRCTHWQIKRDKPCVCGTHVQTKTQQHEP